MNTYHHQLRTVLQKLPLLIQTLEFPPLDDQGVVTNQLQQLAQTQEHLEQSIQMINTLRRRSHNLSYQQFCAQLAMLLYDMSRYSDILMNLADEYAIDPEGTAQCLTTVMVDDAEFLRQVSYLQMAIAHLPTPHPWTHPLYLMRQSAKNTVLNLTQFVPG